MLLVGDLNMKSRAADAYWSGRPVPHRSLFNLAASCEDPEVKAAASSACTSWPALREALRAKEHHPFETKNSSGRTYQRFGVYVKTSSSDKTRLGSPLDSELCARKSFQIDGIGCQEDGELILGAGSQGACHVLAHADSLDCCDLAEALKRIAGIEISTSVQKAIADAVGEAPTPPSVMTWLRGLLDEDGMVDSFAELHPDAKERYTCWDQSKNNRHKNIGSRIDFILVDRALFEQHARRGDELATGATDGRFAPNSPEAAHYAGVMGGKSLPSGFEGGGMPSLEEDEYNAQFRPASATGIVYMPPQLSDHVATSLLLQGLGPTSQRQAVGIKDAATKKCQPHQSSRRITDFFGKKRDAVASGLQAGVVQKRPAFGAA